MTHILYNQGVHEIMEEAGSEPPAVWRICVPTLEAQKKIHCVARSLFGRPRRRCSFLLAAEEDVPSSSSASSSS